MTARNRLLNVTATDHVATADVGLPSMGALELAFFRDLEAVCDELIGREEIRAVVFAVGDGQLAPTRSDGGEPPARSSIQDRAARLELECRALDKLAALPQPTIAAIRGDAFGTAFELTLACDFRVGGRSARIGLPDVARGLFPAGGLARLPLIVGDSTAKRLAMLGEILGMSEAREVGLADVVVPDEAVLPRAGELAARLAQGAPTTIRAIKRILAAQRELSHDEALRLIVETALSRDVSEEARRPGERRADAQRA
jgi:enoyl-CoA hydratase/carnithine racemase